MSDSVRPHRQQPTRLRRPWDSPGKNTGVGCHFLLQCIKVKSESEVAQACPTLSNPMDCGAYQAPPSMGFSRRTCSLPASNPIAREGEQVSGVHHRAPPKQVQPHRSWQAVLSSISSPPEYSCLENPMDREAWKAAVHGATEGRTRLSDFTFTFHFDALEKDVETHSSVLA